MRRIAPSWLLIAVAGIANAQDKPNVVIMLADNVGYGDIGAYGAGELFKDAGYATGIAGKWHLGASEQSWPTRQGFDEYRVGVLETTDGTLYRDAMQRTGLPEAVIAAAEPYIWESDATGTLTKVRPYTVANRGQVEGEIAKASVDFIERNAKAKQPFFLYVGFTQTHYPIRTAPEFVGKSRIGPYGDAIMELDYRTGQILDAIKAVGVEDNTIVIWISDNAAAPTAGPSDTRFGFNGPFRGELGDATEGSIRTIGMVKWPGKIVPRASNEMFAVHDWFPTLASIIGAKVPTDRPIDGVDQSAFITGKQAKSNRESLITFIGDEVGAVRWRQYRLYPKEFTMTTGNPPMAGLAGRRAEGNGFPAVFNIEADPREEVNIVGTSGWVIGPYLKLIGEYQKTLAKYPNPEPVKLTEFGP